METKKKTQNQEPEQKKAQAQKEIPMEEQMTRRQSAPRPTPQSELQKMQAQQMESPKVDANGAMDGFHALAQVIGREQIQKAQLTLQKSRNAFTR